MRMDVEVEDDEGEGCRMIFVGAVVELKRGLQENTKESRWRGERERARLFALLS